MITNSKQILSSTLPTIPSPNASKSSTITSVSLTQEDDTVQDTSQDTHKEVTTGKQINECPFCKVSLNY